MILLLPARWLVLVIIFPSLLLLLARWLVIAADGYRPAGQYSAAALPLAGVMLPPLLTCYCILY